jgi:hypothetical protein
MKPKYIIALVLVLVGTHLFTFATTRYITTKAVLARAQDRMDAALQKEGLYSQVHPDSRPKSASIELAIPLAGGMYYGFNEALIWWTAAALLALFGLAVARYEPRRVDRG